MRGLRIACSLLALTATFALGVLTGRTYAACEVNEIALPLATPVTEVPDSAVLLEVPPLCQHPDFPTGCEVVTATMALRYAGVEVTTDELVDKHLATSQDWYHYKGQFYGPDPAAHFCGDPRSKQSYGCFSPVIRNMLVSYLGDAARVTDVGGLSLRELCQQYVDAGIPVIVWATIGMSEPTKGRSWVLPDGSAFVWPAGEHCLLLVGYDEANYYFNDPTEGRLVAYPCAPSEKRYTQLGRQALVIN